MAHCGRVAIGISILALAAGRFDVQRASAQGAGDEGRYVVGRTLTSTATPAVQLRFGETFKYAGTQSLDLGGISRAEQHFFVEADAVGHISRIYWIQFEGYLPGNTLSYQYPATKVVFLGGLDFITDTFARNAVGPDSKNPASDLGRAESFLHNRDYWIDPKSFMFQRFIHLPTADRRQELMIVYGEDVGDGQVQEVSGLSRDSAIWATLSESLIERATRDMAVVR